MGNNLYFRGWKRIKVSMYTLWSYINIQIPYIKVWLKPNKGSVYIYVTVAYKLARLHIYFKGFH